MLNSLRIENYKRFRELRFEKFQRVNLLTGKNNVGKTAVLEAILLLLDWKNSVSKFARTFRPGRVQKLGDENEHFGKWLFPRRDTRQSPAITGRLEEIGDHTVSIRWAGTSGVRAPAGMVDVGAFGHAQIFASGRQVGHGHLERIEVNHGVMPIPADPRDPTEEAKGYARVALKAGAEDRVEELLRKIEPRLRSVRSLQPYGVPMLYAGIEELPERIPVVQLGHGFSRLLTIMAEIVASDRPVILIDEIENGLHYSALPEIWRGLLTACEHSNVQVFATTHSWECVAAAHRAFSEHFEYPLAVFRLEEQHGEVEVVSYDKESTEYSVEHEWEVR